MLERVILNHRCSGSQNAQASIRLIEYQYPLSQSFPHGWYLYNHENDWDRGMQRQNQLFGIKFCPFCGVELSNLKQ